MEEDRFWALIDGARARADPAEVANGDEFQDRQAQHLTAELRRLSPEEVVAFAMRFDDCENRAYRWELWGAAYWLHGGCGNDGFMDFRANLISLGRENYDRVLENPDTLAELVDRPDIPYMQAEGFQYLAGTVYEEQTGRRLSEHFDRFPEPPGEPAGERWDFGDDDECARRFPRLYARFPEMGD
jgi:hypothetical protein